MRRSEGEVVRVRQLLVQLRTMTQSAELDLSDDRCPPGHQSAQAILECAGSIAFALARLDAYRRAEDDALAALTGEAEK